MKRLIIAPNKSMADAFIAKAGISEDFYAIGASSFVKSSRGIRPDLIILVEPHLFSFEVEEQIKLSIKPLQTEVWIVRRDECTQ